MSLRALLVSAGGLGFMRPFPGTWGSTPPAAAAWLMLLLGAQSAVYNTVLIAALVVFSIICIALGPWSEARFGRKDPSAVVADEVAGQCIPLLFLAHSAPDLAEGRFWPVTLTVAAAFILFRVFDIWKPPPAHRLQSLPAGWGILIDDLLAGAYAAIILHAALYFLR